MSSKPNSALLAALPAPRRQLVWFLCCRILVISLFLGGTIAYQLRDFPEAPHPALRYLYLLVGLSYLQTLVSAVFLRKIEGEKFFVQIQIVWDLLFVTSLIYITGGIESLFSFLFILIIVSASVFLSRKELLLVASAAAILYGSLIDLQFYGLLPTGDPFSAYSGGVAVRDVFFTVFVNVVAFFLTALLSGLLAERLRRSEQAFVEKTIDYEELERLNRTILANIPSGLMIVNLEGRIRSFNAAATRITGYPLEAIYNRDVREIFPEFAVYVDGFRETSRGEGAFSDTKGKRRILGYASTIISDPRKEAPVLLVTFQDLTHLKDLEEKLKRADRLAAVGRLASGMAHEIRNPLASISGSVQLLMEDMELSEEDRRLMGIVVREAERLSGLLTDFLMFARPAPPQLEETNASQLFDELCDLARRDSRFHGLEILQEYPSEITMVLDRQQVHQALWNLIINAAEALDGAGTLRLGIDPDRGAIAVADTGPGIPENLRQKIFDPFFTTKDHGTGLGLASVFAIVEAHGGGIDVSSEVSGGTCFTIFLPTGGTTGSAGNKIGTERNLSG